tara:strand:+ start:41 stop:442 length:402 start_codon:yes stop_codon:yes gene_type:complete
MSWHKDIVEAFITLFKPIILSILFSLSSIWILTILDIHLFYAQNFIDFDSFSLVEVFRFFLEFLSLFFIGFVSSPVTLYIYFVSGFFFLVAAVIVAYIAIILGIIFRKKKFSFLLFSLAMSIFFFLGYELMGV